MARKQCIILGALLVLDLKTNLFTADKEYRRVFKEYAAEKLRRRRQVEVVYSTRTCKTCW
jgi:hypothetical protein